MMRSHALLRVALAALIAIATVDEISAESSICANTGAAIALSDRLSCYQGLDAPQVSCAVPADVQGGLAQSNMNTAQRAADLFSWQQFIALNWPSAQGSRGEPAADSAIDGPGPRVWESWKEASEVYLTGGARPADWREPEALPAACGSHQGKWLMRTAKVDDGIDQTLQALPADATLEAELKDQRGRLVRYEIRLNRPLFEYIRTNRLYDGQIQAQADSVDFPLGSQLAKAAWREVDADAEDFFLTSEACVCEGDAQGVAGDCSVRTMGLAGFHLMTKTEAAPQWIWSTFEQVDNTVRVHPGVEPLNDPKCPADRCAPNTQTERGIPTQLARVIPIPDSAPNCARADSAVDNLVLLNHDVQAAPGLANSFLRYYELVGTQWPVAGGNSSPKTVFHVRPERLGNSTMETFSQNTSSCMGCHAMSRTLNPDNYVSGDFSFTLNNAKPTPRGSRCVDVEASGSCSDRIVGPLPTVPRDAWERERWDKIQLGYRVTTRTYEVLGPRNVGNRLHCESCHLNGGGNPDSAWWVDLDRRYPTASGTTLQARINGCFERSMNGRALCSTAEGPAQCDDDPVMRGLMTYMEWLSREYHKKHPEPTAHSGYPHSLNGNGEAARGQAIYTQKCAFCHNNAGQGRYENHTYFRPALWGPDSFNACAGLSSPPRLASFLKANMPYTSGGMLTDHEANDLAVYIDQQCRPGKGGVGPDGAVCSLAPGCVDGMQVELPADAPNGIGH